MKCTSNNVLVFAVGALVGSAVTWYFAKGYFAKIAQEEIDSVKEVFSNFNKQSDEDNEPQQEEGLTEEEVARAMPVYHQLASRYDSPAFKTEEKEVSDVDRPYVISPNEYGQMYDYMTFELTYYDDGVLADDTDEIVDDIEGTIGYESLKHFGELEDDPDIVHVRNDSLKADYEVAMSNSKYSDIVGAYSHLANE